MSFGVLEGISCNKSEGDPKNSTNLQEVYQSRTVGNPDVINSLKS